jgi:light-harvesting protein B-800-850 alpha chain
MNQGRIWTVVPPTVGLPLIIGGAAVTSLLLHYAILSHTTWYPAYWNGAAGRAKVAETDSVPAAAALTQKSTPAFAINVTPVEGTAGSAGTSFVVTVTPNAADKSVALATPDNK